MKSSKPFYSAAAENSEPVFMALESAFRSHHSVLEIGSGSGQQAVYFCERLPDLTWITSDLTPNHAGIQFWIQESDCANLRGPILLDVNQTDWPRVEVEVVYASNVIHLMTDIDIHNLFSGVAALLPAGGCFYLYGPYKVEDQFLSDTDQKFDEILRGQNPAHGLRSVGTLELLASNVGLVAGTHIAMPKNNQILCWGKPA